MNRFAKTWKDTKKKQDLAEKLKGFGVLLHEPEKFKISELQALYDNHYMRNRNKYLSYREIAELAGVNYNTFRHRMGSGWSLERAILGKPENYLTLKEIAELAGVNYRTFMSRLYNGWTLERAVLGVKTNAPGYLTYKEMAEIAGINYNTMMTRMHNGWTLEEALLGCRNKTSAKTSTKKVRVQKISRTDQMKLLMRLEYLIENGGDPQEIEELRKVIAGA